MKDSIICLSTPEWKEVQSILENLPINSITYELTITKRNEQEFAIQFKNSEDNTVKKSKPNKINPVGLHDLFW